MLHRKRKHEARPSPENFTTKTQS